MDGECLPARKRSNLIGMDDVAVPDALTSEVGVVGGKCLLRTFERPLGANEGGDIVGLLELVNDDRPDCAGEALSD